MPGPSASAIRPQSRPLVVAIGIISLAVGAYSGVSALHFVATSVATKGVIVGRGGSTYTVRFDLDGHAVEFESTMPTTKGFARSKVQVGREVEVRYRRDAPGNARVVGSALWAFPLAMMVIGVLAIAASRRSGI